MAHQILHYFKVIHTFMHDDIHIVLPTSLFHIHSTFYIYSNHRPAQHNLQIFRLLISAFQLSHHQTYSLLLGPK